MKAIVYREYKVAQVGEVDPPAVASGEVLVRVRAAALNAMDWYFFSGQPYAVRLMMGWQRPKTGRIGSDFAGTVEEVGAGVEGVRAGEEVFGARLGCLAELVAVPADRIAPKPTNLTFEQAAAVPIAGVTALQGLRDHARVQPGQRVLVNGAGGGVGTFAVQIAKALGAEVTAVCGTHNVDLVRSIGADRVVDYTREDFTRGRERFDVIFDVAGGRTWSDFRRVLEPRGALVVAGGPRTNPWIGPLGHLLAMKLAPHGSRKLVTFVAKVRREDLVTLKQLIESGKIAPAIDRTYPFAEAAEALRYLGEGRPRAKVVITVTPQT